MSKQPQVPKNEGAKQPFSASTLLRYLASLVSQLERVPEQFDEIRHLVVSDFAMLRDEIRTIKAHAGGGIDTKLPPEPPDANGYATEQVAGMLSTTKWVLRKMCRDGKIPGATKVPGGRGNKGEWRIPPEALDGLRKQFCGAESTLPHPADGRPG